FAPWRYSKLVRRPCPSRLKFRCVILDLIAAAPTVFNQLAGLVKLPVIPKLWSRFLAVRERCFLTYKLGSLVAIDRDCFCAPLLRDLFNGAPRLVIFRSDGGDNFAGRSGGCLVSTQFLIKHLRNRTAQRQRRVGGHLSRCHDSEEGNERSLSWPADVFVR